MNGRRSPDGERFNAASSTLLLLAAGCSPRTAATGGSAPDGAVNVNVSVVGSDDQSYTADLSNDVAECTNFESGLYHLSPGESTTGCVVFARPTGVTVAKVKYTPSEGFASDSGEWLIS